MLTQDVTKELEGILNALQQQGKEPTVAMVKSRLSTSVPLPAIITAIKSWKKANQVPKIEVAAQPSLEVDRVTQLEQTVEQLIKRVEQLEEKLSEVSS